MTTHAPPGVGHFGANGLSIQSEVRWITPQQARELLTVNRVNRKPSKDRVKLYSEAMAQGRWMVTGQAIIISDEGELLDGQHRLLACIQSDTSFPTVVITGPSREVMLHIDEGKPRSAGDVLGIEGVPNGKRVAAALTLTIGFEKGVLSSSSSTKRAANRDAMLERYLSQPDVIDNAVNVGARVGKAIHYSEAVWASLCVLLSPLADEETIAEFIDGISTGSRLSDDDARLAFRNWLINRQLRRQPTPSNQGLMTAVLVWNAHVSARPLRILKPWTPGRPQPVIQVA